MTVFYDDKGQPIASNDWGLELERLRDDNVLLRAELEQAKAELLRLHDIEQRALAQSEDVQRNWLCPCEAVGLKSSLEKAEAVCESVNELLCWTPEDTIGHYKTTIALKAWREAKEGMNDIAKQ
jgi:hypothetical protein